MIFFLGLLIIFELICKFICKDFEFIWFYECEKSFQEVKDLIFELVLVYFDLGRELDSSKDGLGVVLM